MLRTMTFLGAILAAGAVFAAEMRPLPWSPELNKPERYRANTSGEMKISRDAESDALRFDMKFKPGTDFWCYPVFTFQAPFECFPDAEEMRFDVRVESNDPSKPVKLAYLMVEGNEMIAYPKPTGEWQEVRINLKEKVKAPEQAGFFRIGINPTADEATLFLRNVQFLSSRKPSGTMDAAWAVIPAAPGTVFTEKEPLKFTLRDGFQVPCDYVVRDWQGKEVAKGAWPEAGRGELILGALPRGYYTLTLDSSAMDFDGVRGFGIVVDPADRRRDVAHGQFGGELFLKSRHIGEGIEQVFPRFPGRPGLSGSGRHRQFIGPLVVLGRLFIEGGLILGFGTFRLYSGRLGPLLFDFCFEQWIGGKFLGQPFLQIEARQGEEFKTLKLPGGKLLFLT